tara:strand:+ start:728 stop:892 length:165 start_codon:yes stop_codon:yes gene_type:complete
MKTVYNEVREGAEDRRKASGGGQIQDRERLELKSSETRNLLIPGLLLAYVLGIF